MKMVILSVFDAAAEAFMRPFFVQAVGSGVRSFQDEVNRAADDNPLYKHPKDHSLYHLGEFDDHTGMVTAFDRPKLVVSALSVRKGEDVPQQVG